MVDVRFELTTNDPSPADDAICEGLIRWAKGKRLTNRLPNISLTTDCSIKRVNGSARRRNSMRVDDGRKGLKKSFLAIKKCKARTPSSVEEGEEPDF